MLPRVIAFLLVALNYVCKQILNFRRSPSFVLYICKIGNSLGDEFRTILQKKVRFEFGSFLKLDFFKPAYSSVSVDEN